MKTLVVVLNWNTCEMTEACIRSLQAMHGALFEIVIVDNGSRDGSVEKLRAAFPQVTLLANEYNLGFAGGSNIGIRHALEQGAEFVLLVNNDTTVQPDLLSELLAAAYRNPSAGVISPKIYYADHPDRIWWAGGTYSLWQGVPRHIGWKEPERGKYETEQAVDWATGCVLLARSAALREAGLFDERFFANAEDLDLSLRMRELGWQIRYAPKAKLWHKEGFATRRNAGEYARYFTSTRNLLWVMHKHGSSLQWATFVPYFLLRYVLLLVGKSLLRGDTKSALGALSGVAAFWKMRSDPDAAPLPEGLSRPPRVNAADDAILRSTPIDTGH